MRAKLKFFVYGIELIGFILFVFFLVKLISSLVMVPASNSGSNKGYPPPIQTLKPTITEYDKSYPIRQEPNDLPFIPTPTLTKKFWTVSSLPDLKLYAFPTPYREMKMLYINWLTPGYHVINLDGTKDLIWPTWPPRESNGLRTDLMRISPSGNKILYTLWNGMDWDIASIWTMDYDGSNKKRLVSAVDGWYPVDAIWSPDGKRIAFRRAKEDMLYNFSCEEIWVMEADGSNPSLLSENPIFRKIDGGERAHLFRWQSNGYIYFVTRPGELYAINSDSGEIFLLAEEVDVFNLARSLSPDGTKVITFSDKAGEMLYKAGFLTYHLYAVSSDSIQWSPDGKMFAYKVENSMDDYGIHIRDTEKGTDIKIISGFEPDGKGFSPDGRYFAYKIKEGLFTIDLSSGKTQLVVKDERDEKNPTISAITFLAWIPID